MTKGAMPGTASDIFTCGLILHELLANVHPYWRDDPAEYAQLVRDYAAKPPLLAGVMPPPATNAEVSAALHRCLSPNPADRPTAAELRAALSGRAPRTATTAAAPATKAAPAAKAAPATKAAPAAKAAAPGTPLTGDRIRLVGAGGQTLQVGVRTELGKHLARQFGGDAEFWDARQCVLERLPDRRWQVVPVPTAANETLLNGEILVGPRPVHDGDVLAVGRKAKGIVKLPLTLRGA
jgi:hypothetical protein